MLRLRLCLRLPAESAAGHTAKQNGCFQALKGKCASSLAWLPAEPQPHKGKSTMQARIWRLGRNSMSKFDWGAIPSPGHTK